MDPLSLTVSTVTLIQAAGAVSKALHNFVTTFRNADSRVAALSTELSRLIKYIDAIDRTLRKCRGPLSLASMDEDLWLQCKLSLEDCETTLDELATFINRVKSAAKSTSIFRRTKVAIDLTMYAGDITGFEEKIHKSNWAIQTMLSAIQVTLSLRGNETQEKILRELEILKYSIDQSRQAVLHHHNDVFLPIREDPSDYRIAYNLKNLTRAAQSFHSSASSTASTIFNGTHTGNPQSDAAMSLRGGLNFTSNKRLRIDPWVKQQRRMTMRRQRKHTRYSPTCASPSVIEPKAPDPEPEGSFDEGDDVETNISETADDNDEQDDETEFQMFLLSALEELAKESMLSLDFAKAQSMLEVAIQRRTGASSDESDFKQLQIQLAVCYFFQHKWHLAEPLIESIAKSKANFDPVLCNLLHALAIANFVEKRFDKAIIVCKQALYGKRRLRRDFPEITETECNETLGLLATIHDAHGSRLDAEALRRKLSNGFYYYHPENELEFIVAHPKLCPGLFGRQITLDWRKPQILAPHLGEVTELPAAQPALPALFTIKEEESSLTGNKKPLKTFQRRLSLYRKNALYSEKEVVGWNDVATSLSRRDNSHHSSCRPTIPQRPSFARKVVRLLNVFRQDKSTTRLRKRIDGRFGSGLGCSSYGNQLSSPCDGSVSLSYDHSIPEMEDTSWRRRFELHEAPTTETADVGNLEANNHQTSNLSSAKIDDFVKDESSLSFTKRMKQDFNNLVRAVRLQRFFDDEIRGDILDDWQYFEQIPACQWLSRFRVPDTIAAIVDHVPEDLQQRSLASNQKTLSATSEIDVYYPDSHDSIAQSRNTTEKEAKGGDKLVSGTAKGTVGSPTKLRWTPNHLWLANSRAIDTTRSIEQENPVCISDSLSDAQCFPSQQLRRKFSWEDFPGEVIDCVASTEPVLDTCSSSQSPVKTVTLKPSWSSDGSQQAATPELVRSSSFSSSSGSCNSSNTAASSATTRSTGAMLKYDPIEKELFIVQNGSTSPLPGSRDLDDFLARLSSVFDGTSKIPFPEVRSPVSELKSQVKHKKDEPKEVQKTSPEENFSLVLQSRLLANKSIPTGPIIRPKNIYQRLQIEHDDKHTPAVLAWEKTEGMINRRHPLRLKRWKTLKEKAPRSSRAT